MLVVVVVVGVVVVGAPANVEITRNNSVFAIRGNRFLACATALSCTLLKTSCLFATRCKCSRISNEAIDTALRAVVVAEAAAEEA